MVWCSSGVGGHGLGVPSRTATRRFQAGAGQVSRTRREIRACADRCGVRDLDAVALAVSEAVTNAVLHAHAVGDDPPWVEVAAELRPGTGFVVTVADDGHGMRPRTDSPGAGLGLLLIEALTEDLDVQTSPEGTRLMMTFAADGRPSGTKATAPSATEPR